MALEFWYFIVEISMIRIIKNEGIHIIDIVDKLEITKGELS